MWSFWVEANVSILCYIYIYIGFFIYVLPLAINFFKILLYFKYIYIDIIFMQDATDELLRKERVKHVYAYHILWRKALFMNNQYSIYLFYIFIVA